MIPFLIIVGGIILVFGIAFILAGSGTTGGEDWRDDRDRGDWR